MYELLFPFEKVVLHSRILIYGAGTTGMEYLRQLLLTKYCEVVGVVDLHAEKVPPLVVPVYSLEQVPSLSFDYIVIAMRRPTNNERILADLLALGVAREKIIFIGERRDGVRLIRGDIEQAVHHLAYEKPGISLAVQMSSGMGDIIIAKRFVMQLLKLAPEVHVDIFCSSEATRLFFDAMPQLNAFVTPKQAIFTNVCDRYMLAIEHQFHLTFHSFHYDDICAINPAFADRMQRLYDEAATYRNDCAVNEHLHMFYMRAAFAGTSVYEFPRYYQDVLGIHDTQVDIPLRRVGAEAFRELALGAYITVNYGNGVGGAVSKQWPRENFDQLVSLLHETFPAMEIVQLGGADAEQIDGCDRYLLGKSLELVKYVLKESLLHIDIEGGLVHIATQLGTKCIVLFGPTPLECFGYPENINLRAGDCRDCCGIESRIYECARHIHPAPCMTAITPEMVMTAARGYLRNLRTK